MLTLLFEYDKKLLLFLNSFHSPFWDPIMGFVTDKYSWAPMYIGVLAYIFWKFRKNSWWAVLGIASTIVMADRFSSGFCKPYFARLRPCHEPDLVGMLHMVRDCGGQFGFISSHAANSFGACMFLTLLLAKYTKWAYLFWPWAMIVSYSRIYTGVHYPMDVFFGALAGIACGALAWLILQRIPGRTGAVWG